MPSSIYRSRSDVSTALIPMGIALNLALGTLASTLKLPLYLDAVGTITTTMLLGLVPGAIVGVVSFMFAAVLFSPFALYFLGTQMVIALVVRGFVLLQPNLRRLDHVIAGGIMLGLASGIASAPILIGLNAASGSARDVLTAAIISYINGQPENACGTDEACKHKVLVESVLVSGAFVEPIDKAAQMYLAARLLTDCPRRILQRFFSKESIARMFGRGA